MTLEHRVACSKPGRSMRMRLMRSSKWGESEMKINWAKLNSKKLLSLAQELEQVGHSKCAFIDPAIDSQPNAILGLAWWQSGNTIDLPRQQSNNLIFFSACMMHLVSRTISKGLRMKLLSPAMNWVKSHTTNVLSLTLQSICSQLQHWVGQKPIKPWGQ